MGVGDPTEPEGDDLLKQLVDRRRIEGAAPGITTPVTRKGEDVPSEKRKTVFRRGVPEDFVTRECARYSCALPWSETCKAHGNDGKGCRCLHMEAGTTEK